MRRFCKLACLMLLVSCAGSPEDDGVNRQTATIEGVVREAGTERPIAGVSVFAVRTSDLPQVRTITDADGRFTLSGLDAGRHLVALIREGYVVPGRIEIAGYPFSVTTGQHITDAQFHLVPAGTIAGRVLKPDGSSAARVEVQLLQNLYVLGRRQWTIVGRAGSSRSGAVQTNERGEFRATGVDPGEYAVRLIPREATIESITPGGKGPSPILYPGVRDIADAEKIQVNPGRETLLRDLRLKEEGRGWIRILVVNESGESLEGFGNWRVEPPGWIGSDYPLFEKRVVNSSHEVRPDSAGTYDIRATWTTPKGPISGSLRVNYNGRDVNMKMTVRDPRGAVTGSVTLQDTEGADGRPLSGIEVAIGPQLPYFTRSAADGTIRFPAVYEGRYQLGYVRSLPRDTFVATVRQGGRDVFHEDIVVGREETSLELVVRPGAGVVSGTVADAGGQPVHNALVALIPDSPLKNRTDYYGVYQDVRTDQNGRFEIRGLTPGSYQAYAWMDAPSGAYRNSDFMKPYADHGKALEIQLNGRDSLDLTAMDPAP